MRKGIYTLHLIYSTLLGSFCVPGSLFCLLLFPSTNWCDLLELLIESAVCVNKFAIPSAAYVGNYHDQVAWWQQALCELGCWFLWSSFVLMTQSLFFGITGVWSIFFSRDKSGSDAEISMWPCSTSNLIFLSVSQGCSVFFITELKCLWFKYESTVSSSSIKEEKPIDITYQSLLSGPTLRFNFLVMWMFYNNGRCS